MPYTLVYKDSIGQSTLIEEYLSIFDTLVQSVDTSRIKLIRTSIGLGKRQPDLSMQFEDSVGPEIKEFETIQLNAWQYSSQKAFPRDLFVNLGDFIFVDPTAIALEQDGNIIPSPLGEGGKIIHAGKSVLVTEDLWRNPDSRKHIDMLRENGYKFGILPYSKQEITAKRKFIADHIDGHANLILGKNGVPYLLYPRSYADQGGKTGKAIRLACDYAEIYPVEIDDLHFPLPHLAFNFPQFDNLTIVHTGGTPALTEELTRIVGSENVFTTSVPIDTIPSLTSGGIRCLTNLCPQKLLSKIIK
jgi:hypothetical protein